MESELHSSVLKLVIRYGDVLSRIASQNLTDRPGNLRQNEVFKWRETLGSLQELHEFTKDIPWKELSDAELLLLGFKIWKLEEPLRLVPAHLWKYLPPGLELTSIDGETVVYGRDPVDLSTHLGCLAYGWVGKEHKGAPDVSTPK